MKTTPEFARIAAIAALAVLFFAAGPAFAVDFGDNASTWANDGECDDPRFAGPGMTETILLDSDILHDAADCQQGYDAGRLVLDASIGFGDDTSSWANDGECDDPRFEGAEMAETLLDEDLGRDASDCRKAFNAGQIALRTDAGDAAAPAVAQTVDIDDIDFGADGGSWTMDGECDDPRFIGPGASTLDDENEVMNDASDCRQAYAAGRVTLKGSVPLPDVDLGDNSSFWARNGECDDPRFAGIGMAVKTLDEDIMRDAADCLAALETGRIALAPEDFSQIDFGTDGGEWTDDGECDDPRFVGPGRSFITGEDEVLKDATDCRTLFEQGRIRLR
ncbi:MAG TPA: hypothetical protein VMW31_03940 [Devosiaceae bacterium]|nr:hypothetical protein [Devosiaceae bacterium]